MFKRENDTKVDSLSVWHNKFWSLSLHVTHRHAREHAGFALAWDIEYRMRAIHLCLEAKQNIGLRKGQQG